MKRIASVGLTTWMLEHLTFGPHREALSGDLLEELRHGRSAGWYRRQALSAIAIGLLKKSREYSPSLLFSFAWSMFYPLWSLSVERSQLAQTIFTRWSTLDWPYSTASTLLCRALPAITFVWLGFFLYLLSQPHVTRQLSTLRLLRSLSISFNVLLGMWILLRHTIPSVHSINDVFANTHLDICIPFALSLFSALSSAHPHTHHRNTAPLAS